MEEELERLRRELHALRVRGALAFLRRMLERQAVRRMEGAV
jgi:hypothetical protein